MDLRQFRVGNLLKTDNSTEYYEDVVWITDITKKGINITDGIEEDHLWEELQPIKITEKRLLNFGFKIESYIATGTFSIKGIKEILIKEHYYNVIVSAWSYDEWNISIVTNPRLEQKHQKEISLNIIPFKFVHNLQNIYFDNFNQEI